ncbi:MAG TPA: hypothetical protein VMU84_15415 [Thermoanaerobaculia bacterium]|nr:hypothetical protein [Thermoanaerobaculia bacterium]
MTARLSEPELTKWFPVAFQEISDPWAAPEPSLGALIQLDSGEYFALDFGKDSSQLTVRIPETTDPSGFLKSFFSEARPLRSRVLWHRDDAVLPSSSDLPARLWTLQLHPESRLESLRLSPEQNWTVNLLLIKLRYVADTASTNDLERQSLEMPYTVLLDDGTELAPMAIDYVLAKDHTAWIINARAIEARDTRVLPMNLPAAVLNMNANVENAVDELMLCRAA